MNSKPVISTLKWAAVVLGTAAVVMTVQVNADSKKNDEADKQALATVSNASQVWSPSSGFADLIDKVSPAVVHVAITGTVKTQPNMPEFNFPPGSPFEDFFKEFRKRQQDPKSSKKKKRPLGIGSGFIISADGYVVTNNHVIKNADEITVTLTDGKEYKAELKGSDSKTDLALLKLKKAKGLPFVSWGDDSKSRVGDWVLAIGNPFGLGGSATTGIISARGRDIRSGPYDDYIQVDAAINRGNSGGPLFNMQGEVIGINTAIYSPNGGSVGIGFSIPSSMANQVIDQLRKSGQVERGWIGVQIQGLTSELAEGFGLDDDKGALISEAVPGEPADKAGIQAGDIILSFDGEEVESVRDLPRIVAQTKIGKKVPVVVWRNGAKKKLTIKTARYPDDTDLAKTTEAEEQLDDDDLGATLASITDTLRKQYRLAKDVKGVVVVDIEPDGLAVANNLRVGDVISAVSNSPVKTAKQVSALIAKAKKDKRKKIVMLIQRRANSLFIAFDLEAE